MGLTAIDWRFWFRLPVMGQPGYGSCFSGDVNFGYEFPTSGDCANNGGGPRNTFDDTYGENVATLD